MLDEGLSGRRTVAQMARHFMVSEPTVSRILAAHRVGARSSACGEVQDTDHRRAEQIVGILPVAALDERLAFAGTSGSGKTYAAKGLVERLLDASARVCIVDPLGVWWGLRAAADGSALAAPAVVVFGGRTPICRSRQPWGAPSAAWSAPRRWRA